MKNCGTLIAISIALMVVFVDRASAAILVGYWDFDELEGTTVFDQSGFGNHGELTSDFRGPGRFGGGLALNGTGGAAISNSPSLDLLPGGFTMSAWIKQVTFPDYGTIFWKTDRNNRIHMLHFQVGDSHPAEVGKLYAAMNREASSGGLEAIAPPTIGLNEWHYVSWVYDEMFSKFYDNGAEIFSTPFAQSWVGNDIDLLIGWHPEIATANFFGMIDEARIYRGALTRDEILRDMNFQGQEEEKVIPEPSSFMLLGLSLSGIVLRRRFHCVCVSGA